MKLKYYQRGNLMKPFYEKNLAKKGQKWPKFAANHGFQEICSSGFLGVLHDVTGPKDGKR